MPFAPLPFSFWKNNTVVAGGNPANPTLLWTETFDTAPGYDNTWGVGIAGTAIDPDYTATVLEGTQSLRLQCSGNQVRVFAGGLPVSSPAHMYLQIHPISFTGSTACQIFTMRNPTGATILTGVTLLTGGQIRFQCGTTTVDTGFTVTAGTTYHLWVEYVAGTGANAIGRLACSTTAVRPATNIASITTANATLNFGRLYLGNNANATFNVIYDRIVMAASAIYDNP